MAYQLNKDQIRREGQQILGIAEELYERRVPLARERLNQEIDGRSYADQLNSLIMRMFEALSNTIRPSTYVDLLGISYSERVRLVDPDILEASPVALAMA